MIRRGKSPSIMGVGEESEAQTPHNRLHPTASQPQLTAEKERIQLWVSDINSSPTP